MSDEGPVNKKPKTVSSKRFQFWWYDDNPSWKIWVKDVPNDPTKFFCKACRTTLICGLSEIKKHSLRENHLQNMKKLNSDDIDNPTFSNTPSIEKNNSEQSERTQSFSDLEEENFNFNERVKIAEIRLATFFVEKNLPFSISTDLLSLMKDIGKEPGILQTMSLGRTKLTQIINNVVCRQETDRIVKVLRENKFAVYEDETSDITNDKWLSLMVRYVEPKTLHVRCELLQMIHLDATDCSANNIFQSFQNELLKKNISLRLIVSLACDNASVMVGKNSSFKTRLSEKNPNLVTLPCVCHSAALAAKEACELIPRDCERFIKNISTFISGSPKRTAIFRDFQMCFEKSSLNILKHAETRWLTRQKCIERILEMWDTLGKFLMEQVSENVRSADDLLQIIQKPPTKAYFFFLEFALDAFNKYNAKFQTRKSLIHELQPYSMELLLWFLRKFIKSALLKPEMFGHIVRNLRSVETVLRAVNQERETSIRVIAREHNLSYSTVQRILKEEKLHAYHYTRVQDLREEDYPRRRRFCEYFLRRVDEDPEFPSRVIFSDESLFTREGIFNCHNMHVWSDANPRVTRSRNFQTRWKLNVWAGILGTNILGPVILPDILNGASYLEFLSENLPHFLEEVPLANRNKIIFQQDGAGPHNARVVTNYLNERFPGRWMGRYGPITWPARSPDLNPLDFFLWGHCKEIIYRKLPENVEDLNDKLHYAIWNIDQEILEKMQMNLLRRMRACVAMDGGHFEHLL